MARPDADSATRRLRSGALVLRAISGAGVVGYLLAGWSLLDAPYMVVITVFREPASIFGSGLPAHASDIGAFAGNCL